MDHFVPQSLPVDYIDFERLSCLIGTANRKISLYSGMLEAIPNVDVLIAPMTVQEAVVSSKIEGTQASFSEFFKSEAGEKYDPTKTADIQEILNYKNALRDAEEMFESRPFIHLNMIKKLHETLLQGVRGANKARGKFRTVQNYIGSYGCKIEDATYIPPSTQSMIPALDNLEKFTNRDDLEPLVQLAQVHAQFELIHPFLSRNGRIGRILISLFLQQKQFIKRPVFYLSEYFENNRGAYYYHLDEISKKNKWNEWIEFFLNAVCAQSELNSQKVGRMISLYDSIRQAFLEITKSKFAIKILDSLFKEPIIQSSDLIKVVGVESQRSGRLILQKLIKAGVIGVYKERNGPNPAVLSFPDLLNLLEGRDVL
ncbi:MAG: Fic family protein [Holosporales bacterium]|jgi:Fic family protein|nr:Fic family protein [Holosporales bacterium]